MSRFHNAIAVGALALAASFAASAQHSSGNLMGEAKAGDTIVLQAPEIGVKREIAIDKDGKFNVRRLPMGTYVVTVRHADGTSEDPKAVVVRGGTTVRVQ
jgi:RNase adaptor protein for sRNA GlmZ degradation